MARKISKKSQLKSKSKSKIKKRLSFTNCPNLQLDREQPESSQRCSGIPQSAEALKTKEVSAIVGIPVLDLGTIVEDDDSVQSEQETGGSVPSEHEDGDGEWTQVKGKRSLSPNRPSSPIVSDKGLLQLTAEDVAPELQYWDTAVVCYVLGANPPWELLSGFVKKLWGAYKPDKISFLPNGVFLVRFPTKECQSLVLQQGFPMYDNKPLVVKPWSESCSLLKERVKVVPIWLRLCGLPLKFWSKSSLEKLAGLLGKFVRRDAATEDKTRLGYARLLVEVQIGQDFPDKIFFRDEKGDEVSVLVEYEWKPTICSACKGIGHIKDMCRKKSVPVPSLPTGKTTKVWRPVQRQGGTAGVVPAAQTQPPEIPFRGITYHNSANIISVPVIQQITRQEHHDLRTDVSPAKSYAEALSPKSMAKQSGGMGEPPETKVKSQDFDNILSNLGTHWQGINNSNVHSGGRIWIIWVPQVFTVTAQAITVQVSEISSGDSFLFTVVYGFNDDHDRLLLWQDLKFIQDNFHGPWGVCGDFNNVLNFNERIGSDVLWSDIVEFRECVQYCGLVDIKRKGAFYTWNNKQAPGSRSYSRIDRFLVNAEWMDLYPLAYAHFLPEGLFDHNPCVCYRREVRACRRPPFRYYNMWSIDPGFKAIVQSVWSSPVRVGVAKALLEDIQIQLQALPSCPALIEAEREAADSLRHLSKVQYSFLSQKAKLDWTTNGDENTRFFHNHIRARQIHNSVMSIKGSDGAVYNNPKDIESAFLDYYKSLLGTCQATADVHFPTVRTGKLVTNDHKQVLLAPVSAAEIKECIFSIASTKSPGPDGFSSQFFKDSWDIVGGDIIAAVTDFFTNGKLLKELNTTTLTLIPKIDNPTSVLDFRPIACCNTVYKCISKVLCKRLSKILPDIVNESQGGFIKGRNIVENVLICQDLVRLYNRKAASPRCLIKIDLQKAYDSVEWVFLKQILSALKFPVKFMDLIMQCVTSPTYTLVLNGSCFGFFQGKRGLRQGDPLSPLLFTLCMEYLSRILGVVAQQEDFRFHPLCGHLKLNHLLFADDLLLFSKGTAQSIMWILRGFATFSAASGLNLNKSKSNIYFNGVPSTVVNEILQVSGFQRGTLPFKYLGVPISAKKLSKNDGMKLTDRIVARIRGWGTRHLSYAGRLTLVTSVLTSLHSYWATIFLIPNSIMNCINAICRNFLWAGKSDYQKPPSVSWAMCCMPKEEGGLGIKEAKSWNKALLGKYAWWLAKKQDHLWVKWVNHVYMKGMDWKDYSPPLDCSWSWRKIAHTLQTFHQAYTGNNWLNSTIPYTVHDGYEWPRLKAPKVPWRHICWNQLNVPKWAFIFWAVMHRRLLTKDRLIRMGITTDSLCEICCVQPEDHFHLFGGCDYFKTCCRLLQLSLKFSSFPQYMVHWFSSARKTKLQRRFLGACYVGLVYAIWRVRNEARIDHYVRRPSSVIKAILAEVLARFNRGNITSLKQQDLAWIRSIQ
ncbi:uncharacterized protein LOC141613236 [Silene latifolia]|uniref:uncharacterized protein LOC141613236 n=1 Tax=Silene latifolia TaxID=37657 RepID=UPI003D777C15